MVGMKRKRRKNKDVIVAFGIGLPKRLIGIIPPIPLEKEKEFHLKKKKNLSEKQFVRKY